MFLSRCVRGVARLGSVLSLLATTVAAQETAVPPMFKDLLNPESVAISADLKIFVTVIGEFNKDGDGSVAVFEKAKRTTLVGNLNDPKGIVLSGDSLYVTDKTKVLKISLDGKSSVLAAPEAFPVAPKFLNDIEVDAAGNLYVTDSGDLQGGAGAVYKIAPGGKVTTVIDSKNPAVKTPNGLLMDGPDHLLLADFGSGELHCLKIADGSLTKIADGFPGADGLARDWDGNVYLSQWKTGEVSVLRGGKAPAQQISKQFKAAADICIHPKAGQILVPDMTAGTLTPISWVSNNPSNVDTSPLAVKPEHVYQEIEFDRPIVLTHAGDGSNRVFIASQKGKVFVLPNDPQASQAKLFFDLSKKTRYADNENEEGFLGFCFHPKFKENGQCFAFYNTTDTPHTTVVSRFRVSKDNPNLVEASSEEELLRVAQPYWNHNGGTIAFGPDGYLYIGLGDGGKANDPHGNGQNLGTLLGSIMRIDVDRKDAGLGYAIPKDNPFVGKSGAAGEIWAYGVRNIWRLSFDRLTGACWAADVGQDIWEEINIVRKGDNLGWNLREGMHRFKSEGSAPRAEFVEPIWEYHHDIGKSVTGGHVYRGKRVPELGGLYVYADYVTGKLWALKYDDAAKRVTANHSIAGNTAPVMSFGEDETGDVYFMTVNGRIFRFASGK